MWFNRRRKRCRACGKKHDINDHFCSACGHSLTAELSANRVWKRNEYEFAVRFEIQDVNGLLRKPLTVEQGTGALWFEGGRYRGFLPAGVYNLGDITKTLGTLHLEQRPTVVLVDTGTIPLKFKLVLGEITSDDCVPLSSEGMLTVKLDIDEESTEENKSKVMLAFFENFMKSRTSVSLNELEQAIHDPIRYAAQKFATTHYARDLLDGLSESDEAMNDIKESAFLLMRRYGLRIVAFDYIFFNVAVSEKSPKFCGRCGSLISDKDSFCGKCGEFVTRSEV